MEEVEGSFGNSLSLLRSIVIVGGADTGISLSAFFQPVFLEEDPNDSFALTDRVRLGFAMEKDASYHCDAAKMSLDQRKLQK